MNAMILFNFAAVYTEYRRVKWNLFSDKLSSSSSLEHLAVRAVHFPAGAKVWARPTYTFNCDAMKISSAALCQDIKP